MPKASPIGVLDCRISDILNMDESILSSAIVDVRGRTLASKTKFGAKDIFEYRKNRIKDDIGIWTRAAIQMVKPFDLEFGDCNYLVASYKDVKIIIIPLPSMKIHVVLVCLRSANAELIMCKFREKISGKDNQSL